MKNVDVSKIDDALFKKEKKAQGTKDEKIFAESKVIFTANNSFLIIFC